MSSIAASGCCWCIGSGASRKLSIFPHALDRLASNRRTASCRRCLAAILAYMSAARLPLA
jgi:hypothetical protein